jgi:hypothetical protein
VCLACPPALTTIDTGSTSDRCCKPDGLRILEQAETRLDVDPNEVTAEALQDCSYACTSRLSIPGSGSLCGSVELYFEKEGTGLVEIHFLGGNASASFSLGGSLQLLSNLLYPLKIKNCTTLLIQIVGTDRAWLAQAGEGGLRLTCTRCAGARQTACSPSITR